MLAVFFCINSGTGASISSFYYNVKKIKGVVFYKLPNNGGF